jgi:2-polyprenyl-6-methoxyphenol hydroxylase-like FAD-dependent oxidoreductase
MERAEDFWFDSTTQIHLDRWSQGRVVLLGDAGYAGGPGGNGTGLAVVGAHVLAGELDRARGDHRVAFRRYEELMRPYVATCQKQGGGSPDFLVPTTWKKIGQRNRFFRMMRYLPVAPRLIKHFATKTATAFELPAYDLPALV